MERQVFLCHASENKVDIVLPIAKALDAAGITYWLDEAEITWGESLTARVNEGLAISRFTIVVLSESFTGKNWPEREMNAVLNMEASTGEVRVLPLLVGDKQTIDEIMHRYPLLNDKRYLIWNGHPEPIIEELKRKPNLPVTSSPSAQPRINVPLPKIRRMFTDRDKSKFLKDSFTTIKDYFRDALKQLESHDKRFETDFVEVNSLKFSATIYVDGDLKKQCVVWEGSFSGGNQISYREGRNIDIQHDNSMNDWLSIETSDHSMHLKSSGMYFGSRQEQLDANGAAEYFWNRFIEYL